MTLDPSHVPQIQGFFVPEGAVTKEPISHLDPGCFTNPPPQKKKNANDIEIHSQVIQFVTFLFLSWEVTNNLWRGHEKHHPKKRSQRRRITWRMSLDRSHWVVHWLTSEASEWRDHLGNLEWYDIMWYNMIKHYDMTQWHAMIRGVEGHLRT